MASRHGPTVGGTDGGDFVHRETVASHYQQRDWTPKKKPVSKLVQNKRNLRICIFLHLLLALLMLTKLMPDILDRVDIFILEVEELEVPAPHKWEYIWLLGSLSSFLGLSAIKKNRIFLMQVYFGLINLVATVPVLLAAMLHFSDFWAVCFADDTDSVTLWQGYPVAVFWYIFLLVAAQLHACTLICSWRLVSAWSGKAGKRA